MMYVFYVYIWLIPFFHGFLMWNISNHMSGLRWPERTMMTFCLAISWPMLVAAKIHEYLIGD